MWNNPLLVFVMLDSRREMVVNAVRRDGAGWEVIVGAGKTRHGDPVIQRRRICGKGGDVQEVTTLVPYIYRMTALYL